MSEALVISEMFSGIAEPIEQWRLSQWETVMERCNLLKGYAPDGELPRCDRPAPYPHGCWLS